MSFILCLAHYCETHGPTPLMVTESLPVGCTTCFEDETLSLRRPSTGSRSLNPADGLASIARSASREPSAAADKENERAARAMETPPESPRVAALQSAHGSYRRDSSFRKTYDENDKKRASPCENCALTLPKKTKDGASPSLVDNNGPILRTRKPYERISLPVENLSPPKSYSSSDSENAISNRPSHRRKLSRNVSRTGTSSSDSSFSSTSHDHYLDYTSTHEPLAPASFSLIRQSCLRTLSCETLPPSSTQFTSSPTSPFLSSQFSSGASNSTSGGPIFFGDPLAGYTTAYIFRIADPNARGRRRVYALMALSTHKERVAMQAFSFLSAAFRDLAAWIQALAETELEKVESPKEVSRNSTPTSSFLSGRRGGGYEGGKGLVPKSKGLAEIVGLPDFFIELHAQFVKLLIETSMLLGA